MLLSKMCPIFLFLRMTFDRAFNADAYTKWTDQQVNDIAWQDLVVVKSFFAIFKVKQLLSYNFSALAPSNNQEQKLKLSIQQNSNKYQVASARLTRHELATAWHIQTFWVKRDPQIKLKCIFIPGFCQNLNFATETIILAHGFSSDKYNAVFRALPFLRAGYNAVVFDHRGHGESSPAQTTFGEKESDDLQAIVTAAEKQFPQQTQTMVLMGWSMGAFTILEALKRYHLPKVKKIILDSPIDQLARMWKVLLENRLHVSYAKYFDLLRKKCYWYDPLQVNPGYDLINLKKTPALFILHKKDQVTPYEAGLICYRNKMIHEQVPLSKVITFNCGHVGSVFTDYDRYNDAILAFLV